jgi:hypothetical protein
LRVTRTHAWRVVFCAACCRRSALAHGELCYAGLCCYTWKDADTLDDLLCLNFSALRMASFCNERRKRCRSSGAEHPSTYGTSDAAVVDVAPADGGGSCLALSTHPVSRCSLACLVVRGMPDRSVVKDMSCISISPMKRYSSFVHDSKTMCSGYTTTLTIGASFLRTVTTRPFSSTCEKEKQKEWKKVRKTINRF